MKFLFTTQPGYGHFYPLVPLAEAAQRVGHEVFFASSAPFCPSVEDAGFKALPAGLAWTEAEIERVFPGLARPTAAFGWQEVARWLNEVWAGPAPRAMTPDLVGLVKEETPDLLVHEQWELGGALAGELTGLPHVMHSQGLLMPPSLWQKLAGPALAGLRHQLGLPDDPSLSWVHRYCYLDDVPPSLQVPYTLPADKVQHYRSIHRGSGRDAPPPWIGELPPWPTVYASMGTVFNRVPQIFDAILEGLATEQVNLVLAVGPSVDPRRFGPQPENVRIERFVPQVAILRQCDVAITHGGYNTVAEALREGVPMLLIPQGVDQPVNAERCVRRGVGLRLSAGEATPSAIRSSVRQLIEDPRYRTSAEQMQEEMEAMPPIEVAVERLERLAVSNR